MTMNEQQNLLDTVIMLCEHNKRLINAKKEAFNIFTVLRKKNEEVGLHSAFISHLLDPQADHAMGNRFLKLFLNEVFNNEPYSDFTDSFIVKRESTEGEFGRLDIKIYNYNRSKCIVIENKLNAADGAHQLFRYKEYLKGKKYKNWKILYLTKYGEPPSDYSLNIDSENGVQEHEYACISYKLEIINWLRECQREAVDHPALRETIKQYLLLVKHICGEDLDSKLKEKVQELVEEDFERALRFKKDYIDRNNDIDIDEPDLTDIKNKKYYDESIILIDHSYNQVRLNRAKKVLEEIYIRIKNELFAFEGFSVENNIDENKWNQILIRNDNRWPENVWVTIQAQGTLLKGMIKIGVRANESLIERGAFNCMLKDCDIKYKNKPTHEFAAIENLIHFGHGGSDRILIDEEERGQFINETVDEMLNLSKSLNVISDQNWRNLIK